MARRYETYTSQCGWAMEPCEERLFIAFYEDVRGNIDPSIKWPDKFEIGFYQEGFGVLGYVPEFDQQSSPSARPADLYD